MGRQHPGIIRLNEERHLRSASEEKLVNVPIRMTRAQRDALVREAKAGDMTLRALCLRRLFPPIETSVPRSPQESGPESRVMNVCQGCGNGIYSCVCYRD